MLLQSRGELETVKEMIAQMGAHLAAEAQDDADSSDSDSEEEDEDEEEQEAHRSRGRGGAGGVGSVGSAEEKRGSLSPAGSRHSSGE